MSLIKCPECGREVSDKAESCIHCGYPLDKIEENQEIEQEINRKIQEEFGSEQWTYMLGIIFLFFGIIIGMIIGYKLGSWGIGIGIAVSSLITGSFFIALAKIIGLLEEIKAK